MKIIGFSSGVVGREGNVDRMVKEIMSGSGYESEFVKLTDINYSGCKGCVELCAKPQVCVLKDDLFPYYQKIREADAVIVGSPVYSGNINANALAFIERFFGYGHVVKTLRDKPFVLVISGYRTADVAAGRFRRRLRNTRVNILDVVYYKSWTPPCVSCGRHKECSVGGLYRMYGDKSHSLEISSELIHHWEDDPETVAAVNATAMKLRNHRFNTSDKDNDPGPGQVNRPVKDRKVGSTAG